MTQETRQLVYVSDASFGLSKDDIENILAVSRRNNSSAGITGLLIYSGGIFIQALEGRPESVGALFDKISDDRRHDNVDIVSDATVDDPVFADWSMAFLESTPDDLGRQAGIDGTLNHEETLKLLRPDQGRVGTFLRNFAQSLQ